MRRPRRAIAAYAQPAGGTQSRSFHDVLTRVLWALILSPPLIALLALAALTLIHRPAPVHTGDALLDAYLQAVLGKSVEVNKPSEMAYTTTIWNYDIDYETLTGDDWLKLEDRFGDDPRFWLLCFAHRSGLYRWCGPGETGPANYVSQVANVELSPDFRYLEEARRRKATNLLLLQSLCWGYRSFWREEAIDSLKLKRPARYASQKDLLTFESRITAEIDSRHGQTARKLLSELKQLTPQSAIPVYIEACQEVLRGNPAHARALIREENQLAMQHGIDNEYQYLSFADQYLALSGADGLAASWLPSTASGFAPTIFQSQLKPAVQALVNAAAASHDAAMLEELHLMSCNIAREVGFDRYQTRLSADLAQMIISAVPQILSNAMTKDQSADLSKIQKIITDIKAERKNVLKQYQSIGLALTQPSFPQEVALTFAGEQHWAIAVLQANAQCAKHNQAYRAKMAELYSKLERFDYMTLSWRKDAP